MRLFRYSLSLIAALAAAPLMAEVLGVTRGSQPSDYDVTLDRQVGAYDWHVIRPPKPDPQFVRYETNSIKGLGICRILAFTRPYGPGEVAALAETSNRLHSQLTSQYGQSKTMKTDSGEPVPNYWLGKAKVPGKGIVDLKYLATFWIPQFGATLPDEIESVMLLMMPDDGKDTRTIVVIYSFPENSECVERHKEVTGKK